MKPVSSILLSIFILILFQGCNTLYNTHTISIEIIEPGKVVLSPDYKIIAVKYNNCNIELNPIFATFMEDEKKKTDLTNIDSIASEIYYNQFVEHLVNQNFFDSIIILNPTNYSDVEIIDSQIPVFHFVNDTIPTNREKYQEELVSYFTSLIHLDSAAQKKSTKFKTIDPEFGLFTKEKIVKIADSTNADVLFSLDYYYSLDVIEYLKNYLTGIESIQVVAFWNIYDLQNHTLLHFHTKIDTISWRVQANSLKHSIKLLPPRKDAILNAAHIASTKFAEYLVPHWIEVQRMYYHSSHIDLKKTDKLIEENRWREATKIWKANVNNRNENIAAKSKYNMAVACEMEGNLEAAVDWVVQSFHVFGSKNEVHYNNCLNYLNILNLRKVDVKKIDVQFDGVEP